MKFLLVVAVVLGVITLSQEVFGSVGVGVSSFIVVRRRKCFAKICSSNPSNQIRGNDTQGSGAWGASRGSRPHEGIDIVCDAGSSVYAPFPAKVRGRSIPYLKNNATYNTGIFLKGTGSWAGYRVKMWYVTMGVKKGQKLSAGSFIGNMTDRANPAPGMTNHVHVQLKKNRKKVNPTPFTC